MDGGQWGDAMRAMDRVRERVAGLEDVGTKTAEALGRLDRRLSLVEEEAPQPTLRDRFAMAALPSFLTLEAEELGYEGAAEAAYGVADAMLRAREVK